jgi:hypothetical protein
MKVPIEMQKEIKELQGEIIHEGIGRLRSSNIERKKKLRKLIKEANEITAH